MLAVCSTLTKDYVKSILQNVVSQIAYSFNQNNHMLIAIPNIGHLIIKGDIAAVAFNPQLR